MNDLEVLPEPTDVYVDFTTCPVHSFHMINVPRDAGNDQPRRIKCPLRICSASKPE